MRKMMQHRKDEKGTYRQHATKSFSILRVLFSVIYTFEESLYNEM